MRVLFNIYPNNSFLLHFEPYIYKYSQTHNLCQVLDFSLKSIFPLNLRLKNSLVSFKTYLIVVIGIIFEAIILNNK